MPFLLLFSGKKYEADPPKKRVGIENFAIVQNQAG